MWEEIRSWSAVVISLAALGLSFWASFQSHKRAEQHRVQALRESDFERYEQYWHELKHYLLGVNSHRAEVCQVINGTVPLNEFDIPELAYPTRLWPVLPGPQKVLAAKAFELCGKACSSVRVFEARVRRKASNDLVLTAEDDAEKAIGSADEALEALSKAVEDGRLALRT